MYSKEEILNAYLNSLYFGTGSGGQHMYGVQAAAQGIFGVDAKDLNIAQAAYLAGMIQRPNDYNPFKKEGLERGKKRMEMVLQNMLDNGKITQQQYEEARSFDIKGSLTKEKQSAYSRYPYIMLDSKLDLTAQAFDYYREQARAAVVAGAINQAAKSFREDVSDMEALIRIKFKDDPAAALQDAIDKGDKAQAVAAQNLLFKQGGSGVSKFRQVIESNEQGNPEQLGKVSDSIRENISENHGQYAKAKGADIVKWAGGASPTLTQASAGSLSDNDLASQHSDSIRKMVDQNNVSAEQAARVLNDPRVSANLDNQQKAHLQRAIDTASDGSGPLSEIDRAHEEALVQNALYDLQNRNNNGRGGNNP